MADLKNLSELQEKIERPAPAGGEKKPPPATKGKAKKQAKNQLLWTVRVEQKAKGAWSYFREIARGLLSKDAPTRKMSAVFFLSLMAFCIVLAFGVRRYRELRASRSGQLTEVEKSGQHLGEFLKRQAEEAKHKASQVAIGTFTVELKPEDGQRKFPGVFNMAELDIVLDCDSKETRDYVEDHQPEVRNQVTNFFVAMDRSDLMTKEGKKRFKKALIDRLNTWLPKGKIDDVYITRFLMT